ncbi:MAG: hypothetical protein ACRDJH_17375 [Thermomicrobiales bacterium]
MRARRSILHPRLDRALIALAVLCVLTMPVEYRGGADVPHAHAVFQFWAAGNGDAFDHHGLVSIRSDAGWLPVPERHVVGGRLLPADVSAFRTSATTAPPDVPLLSELTGSAERAVGLAVTVSAATALLALTLLRRLPIATVRIPVGCCPAPDAPPPREKLPAVFCVG